MGKECLPGLLCPFQAQEPRVLDYFGPVFFFFFKVLVFPVNSFTSIKIKTFFSVTWSPSTSQGQCLHWVSIMVASGGKVYWLMICLVLTILWANPSLFFIKLKKKSTILFGKYVLAKCPDACFSESLIPTSKEAMKSSTIKCFINNFNILQS